MEIPYTVSNRPDTGLWNAKIGIWLFLASEVMLFGATLFSLHFLAHRCSAGDVAAWAAQRPGRHHEHGDPHHIVGHRGAGVGGAEDETLSGLLVVHAGHDHVRRDFLDRQARLRMAAEVRALRRLH